MPRLTKKIAHMIDIPDVWEWNPLDAEGNPIFKEPKTFELGGGKIKVFSLDSEDFSGIRDESMKASVDETGKVTVIVSEKQSQENLFSARCGREAGSWVGFFDRDGSPLNANRKNQGRFSHIHGLNYFVVNHVGPLLDKIAEDEASEEEKNLFASLTGQAGGAKESTPKDAKHAGKHGRNG